MIDDEEIIRTYEELIDYLIKKEREPKDVIKTLINISTVL